MSFSEIITLSANIALTLTFVVGLVFGIAQVKAAERDRRERLTLDTLKSFESRDFAELIQYVISAEFPKTNNELRARPVEQQVMFIQFAQQMEMLGILVAENFIDIDLVDKTLGEFVTGTWKKYKVMFLTMREGDPFLGEYYQWLAEYIEQRMKASPREPFYKAKAYQINNRILE